MVKENILQRINKYESNKWITSERANAWRMLVEHHPRVITLLLDRVQFTFTKPYFPWRVLFFHFSGTVFWCSMVGLSLYYGPRIINEINLEALLPGFIKVIY